MANQSKARLALDSTSVFFLFCPLPLILFLVGWVLSAQALNPWPPFDLLFLGCFLSGIGLIWGLRLRSHLRPTGRDLTGLTVALCIAGAPIALTGLAFILVFLSGVRR